MEVISTGSIHRLRVAQEGEELAFRVSNPQ